VVMVWSRRKEKEILLQYITTSTMQFICLFLLLCIVASVTADQCHCNIYCDGGSSYSYNSYVTYCDQCDYDFCNFNYGGSCSTPLNNIQWYCDGCCLSSGAIAGIVIGCVFFVIILPLCICFFCCWPFWRAATTEEVIIAEPYTTVTRTYTTATPKPPPYYTTTTYTTVTEPAAPVYGTNDPFYKTGSPA